MRKRRWQAPGVSLFLSLACAAVLGAPLLAGPSRGWERWENCTHLPDRYYDGDSFQIKYGKTTLILRLYGADAPETADHPDEAGANQRAVRLRGLEAKARQERKGLWSKTRRELSPGGIKEQLTPRIFKPPGAPAPQLVNLNTASVAELEGLPGVGAKTAELIIRARPLKDFTALDAISGFGIKKVEALRGLVNF